MFHEGNLHEKVIFSRAYRFIDLKVCVQVLFLGWGGVGWLCGGGGVELSAPLS